MLLRDPLPAHQRVPESGDSLQANSSDECVPRRFLVSERSGRSVSVPSVLMAAFLPEAAVSDIDTSGSAIAAATCSSGRRGIPIAVPGEHRIPFRRSDDGPALLMEQLLHVLTMPDHVLSRGGHPQGFAQANHCPRRCHA